MDKVIKIGIIGGSGLDDPQFLASFEELNIETPFGAPASPLISGQLNGVSVVILSRHGRNHGLNPTQVPYQANLWALKEVGCTHILATTACGSLREEIHPGDLIFADQFIDNTKQRILTIHEDKVVHTPMAEPFCAKLRELLATTANDLGFKYQSQGTVITIEGPRFSTRAESRLFKSWGADIINMSTVPEVTMARELGLCYQIIAMSTDYDSWKEGEEPVTWDMISARMNDNADKVKKLITETLPKINFIDCFCR
jgi:5'-methylthioadenosine phosphorylase